MKCVLFVLGFYFSSVSLTAQLGTAPDFTVTDINNQEFHLYEELDLGKVVILSIGTTWCEPCLDFYNENYLQSLYNTYGPEGSDQIRVLFYESDSGTTVQDLNGNSGNTLQNWTENITFPIVNEIDFQLPLDVYAANGIHAVKIIRPDNYEITHEVNNAQSLEEIVVAINESIELAQDTGLPFSVSHEISNISCFGNEDGAVLLNVSGGVLPYEVEWSNSSSNLSLSDLSEGQYTYTVIDAFGTEVLGIVNIEEPESLQINDIVIEPEFGSQQNGSILVVTEGGVPPYSYMWNEVLDTISTITQLSSGIYTVTINDQNGCEVIEEIFVDFVSNLHEENDKFIKVYPNPTASKLIIEGIDSDNITSMQILNAAGIAMRFGYLKNGEILEITPVDYPDGIYYLKISFNDGTLKCLRFIVD